MRSNLRKSYLFNALFVSFFVLVVLYCSSGALLVSFSVFAGQVEAGVGWMLVFVFVLLLLRSYTMVIMNL